MPAGGYAPTDRHPTIGARCLRSPTTARFGVRPAATVGVGFAHAVLFVLAYFLLASIPGGRAPDEELCDSR